MKKVVLFVVEGITDKISFEYIMDSILKHIVLMTN